mgnify:CR=1 FL=1
MIKETINHSGSFEHKGNFFCVECKRIKDDSEDDCECLWNKPKKLGELK